MWADIYSRNRGADVSFWWNQSCADPDSPEPDLVEVEKHLRKRKYAGQREELVKNIPHSKVLHTMDENEQICEKCGNTMVKIGEEFVHTEVQFIPAKLKVIDHYWETCECRSYRKKRNSLYGESPSTISSCYAFLGVCVYACKADQSEIWIRHSAVPSGKRMESFGVTSKQGNHGELTCGCLSGLAPACSPSPQERTAERIWWLYPPTPMLIPDTMDSPE